MTRTKVISKNGFDQLKPLNIDLFSFACERIHGVQFNSRGKHRVLRVFHCRMTQPKISNGEPVRKAVTRLFE